MPRVYLDTCCLNRPFDDQSQARIRLEAEAVLSILSSLEREEDWDWVRSEVVQFETGRIPDAERNRRIRVLLQFAHELQTVETSTKERANDLQGLGFRAVDALHVACDEEANCDILLTTDDRMLSTARRCADQLHVRVDNPVDWLREREQS